MEANIKISRVRAMPSAWTFTIKPIQELLERYVGDGKGWVDLFAGKNSPAEITNDINPQMPSQYHLDATEFALQLPRNNYNGVLFDPPYSYRQVSEHYKAVGRKVTALDTSTNFYNRAKNAIADKIQEGGYAISFGWDSNGFGKNSGFKIVEILLVAHGNHHHDTIVTVERKLEPH